MAETPTADVEQPVSTGTTGEWAEPDSTGTTGEWNAPRVVPNRPPPVSESGAPTPVERDLNKLPPKPPATPALDPEAIPDWTSVTKSPTYQEANNDDRLAMLDNYTQITRDAGHSLAAKNQEDPSLYDKHIDEFYSREKDALQGPFSVYDNSVRAGVKEAAKTTAGMVYGAAQDLKTVIQPEALNLNLSDIGKMSVDEAKETRDQLLAKEKDSGDQYTRAQQFIDNTKAGVRDDDYAGGLPTAIKTLRDQTSNQKTVEALNSYIDSNGQNVPEETAPDKAINWLKDQPKEFDKIKVDDIYLREHPRLAEFSKSVGHMIPLLAAGGVASALEGGLGPLTMATDLLTNTSDAFATHYEGAKEQIEQRKKNGEVFTPHEEEQMALDDGSKAAFGVGLFNTAANVILGSAMEGLHVPEGQEMDFGAMKTNLANWLKGETEEGVKSQLFPDAAKGIAAEMGGQTAIMAGSQMAGNLADQSSGVAPDKDIMEGVPEAMGQGAIFGGFGAVARAGATAFKLGLNTAKVQGFTHTVRGAIDHLTSDESDGDQSAGVKSSTPLTREQALEVALNEHVPPGFRDSVRAKIALDETSKDQANVADQLRQDGSTQTADAMQNAADADANANTTPVVSQGDRLKAKRDAITKAVEEKKAKEAAEKPTETGPKAAEPKEGGTPPKEGPEGTVPEGGTPPEGGAPPTGTAETPTETTTPPPPPPVEPGASNEELHAKMDQLLGPGATVEQKRRLLNTQYFSQVYNEFQKSGDPDENLYRRSYPTQMSHELGINTLVKAPAKWAKHTPELQAEMRNHFSDWLDQQIAEKNKPAEVPQAVPEETPAGGVEPTAQNVLPPPEEPGNILRISVLRRAAEANDPWTLAAQLQSGKKMAIHQDDLEQYDDFLVSHGFEANYDKASGDYFLDARNVKAPNLREMEIPIRTEVPEAETDYTPLKGNDPELAKETDALPPHPEEEKKVAEAVKQLQSPGLQANVARETGGESDPNEIISAALGTFRHDLRAKPPDVNVNINTHLRSAIKDFNEKASAAKRVKNVKSLDRPSLTTGKEGHETMTQVESDQEEAVSRERKEEDETAKDPGTGKAKKEVDEPVADTGSTYAMGHEDWKKYFSKFIDTLTDPAEKRAAWHAVEILSGQKIKAPEGIKSARGIKQSVHDAVNLKWAAWARKNFRASRGEETHPPDVQSKPAAGGEAGHVPPPDQPESHAPAHEGAVSEQQPASTELRPTTTESGGRQSGLSEEGQAVTGHAPGILPGTAGAEGEPGHVAGGPGIERTEPAGGTGIITPPTGEQAIHIRPREGETPGGTGQGAAAGGGGPEPAGRPEPAGGVAPEEYKGLPLYRSKRDEKWYVQKPNGEHVGFASQDEAKGFVDKWTLEGAQHSAGVDWAADPKRLAEAQQEFNLPKQNPGEDLKAYTRRAANTLDFDTLKKLNDRYQKEVDTAFDQQFAANLQKAKDEGHTFTAKTQAKLDQLLKEAKPTEKEEGKTPEADAKWNPYDIAQAMLKNTDVAEDHGFYSVKEDYEHDPGELAKEIVARERQDHADPNEYYRELYDSLGLDIPGETEHHEPGPELPKPAPKADVKPNVPKPQTPAAANLKATKMTEPETRALDSRIGQAANLFAKDLWANKTKMSSWGLNPHDFETVNDVVVRLGEMFRGVAKGKSFREAMDTIQGIVPQKLDEPGFQDEPAGPTPEQTTAKIQGYSIADLSKKLADHFEENPDRALAYGMANHNQAQIARTVQQMFKTPEERQRVLQSMAQKEGLIDPPTTPGGTESSGVMNSLATGMKHAGPTQGGKVTDLIRWLRRSPDPELQAFAKSLNGNRDAAENLPIRQLNHNAPVAFYHDGELWATPSMLREPNSQRVIAHEIQHAIAQRKVTKPMLPHDFAAAGGWEDMRDELRRSLPADLRDALDSHLADMFSDYDAREELDTRYMTDDEKNWLPVLYAAHSPENMLHATFGNRYFRDHLDGIKRADGSSLLDGVHSWGRTIFGDQAFKFADESHPYVSERPGIPAQFDPKVFDLKDSYPLTESEQNAQRTIGKYQLNNGAEAALRQVESLSEDPNHKVLASALRKIVANHPEIKLGLENRIGGYAGGYDFQGDRVTVNPRLDDHNVEQSIVHEVTHALTVGKIDAFEKGQVHLLTADEMHAIGDLEDIRQKALLHRDVPDEIKQISTLPTYQRREAALLDLFQRQPEMEKWYGLTDTREFASEALSNGQLQDHLKKIPYQTEGARPKTLLHQMFDWVKRFLGFKDDTLASKALDAVATLSGGRRVMEADVNTGNLSSGRTMTMQENLLAKRYLDHRAELEGFRGGAGTVPREQLNSWLNEYRENKGMASGKDAYAPRSIAGPETRAHFKPTPELAAMTNGHEILDHLGKLSGLSSGDTEGLSVMADRAFKDKAITTAQYFAANGALRSREDQTMNLLRVNVGNKEDQDSLISKIKRKWKETVLPEGVLPKELHSELLEHEKYGQNLAATNIRRRFEAFDKAVNQSYKGVKLTPKIRGDMDKVLRGEPVPRSMPTAVANALQDMRADLDEHSSHIALNGMVSDEKAYAIRDNLGQYITRSYRMFDDPSYRYRPESTQWQAKAEQEVDQAHYLDVKGRKHMLLSPSQRTALVKDYADHQANEAARPFEPGTVARQAAYLKAYAAAEAKGKANPAALFIDKKMAEWTQIARNRATKGMQYGHAFNINDKNMEELSPILNQSPSFRKMMGEETDPKALYARTLWRQSAFIHSVQMSRDSAALGRQNGWLSDRFSSKLSAQIPSQFSHLGELAGQYTTPDIADALTDYAQNMRAAQEGVVGGTLRTLESRARWMATIGSLQRGMGNVWSGVFSHLNNGYFNPFDSEAYNSSINLFKSQMIRMNNDQLNAYMDQMHKYGLADKSGNVALVMDFLKSGPHILARDPMDLEEQFSDFAKKALQNKGLRGFTELAMDLHTFGNLMSKGSQWEREVKRRQAVNDWDVNNVGAARMTPEQLRAKAAEIVREQNISYSLATKTVQQLRKNPTIGTFLTFAGESIRSYLSSMTYALDGLKSKNPIERQIGVARMGGLLTSMAIPGALMMASRGMFGVSAKEDRNFRSLLPPWEQHNSFFYGPAINGRRTYTNINYNTPQGDIARSINALFTPNPDGIIGQVTSAGREMFAPLFNFGLIPGALIDTVRNQTAYGTQVYNPNDSFWNRTTDQLQHIFQPIGGGGTPGRFVTKIIPGLTTPGGKVTRGGAVYDFTSSVVPEFMGLNVKEISYPDRFRSEMYSSKDSIDKAQQLFTGPIQRSNTELTDDQMKALYQRSEDARRNVFNELHQKVEAARFGGMNTQAIKTALKSRRYTSQEIDDIMTGRYRPYKPGAAVLKNARANGNFVPHNLFGRATTPYEDSE